MSLGKNVKITLINMAFSTYTMPFVHGYSMWQLIIAMRIAALVNATRKNYDASNPWTCGVCVLRCRASYFSPPFTICVHRCCQCLFFALWPHLSAQAATERLDPASGCVHGRHRTTREGRTGGTALVSE